MDYEPIITLAKKHFYLLHRRPELSGEEFETTRHIKAFLTQQGIPFYDLPLETGVVAHLGNGQGPVAALRCDIDALPLQEETGLPYQSEIPGRMHACGHDFHTANLLGTALALKAGGPIPGTLKLIFQPAEEKLNGALKILETGILDDVQVIFGLHCCAAYERGTVISRPGFMNGAVDEFQVSFQGKGSHACRPQLSADPVIMLGQFIAAAQTIVSRNRPPLPSPDRRDRPCRKRHGCQHHPGHCLCRRDYPIPVSGGQKAGQEPAPDPGRRDRPGFRRFCQHPIPGRSSRHQ